METSKGRTTAETTNVRILPGFGKRDAAALLEVAKTVGFEDCVIIGFDADNNCFFSSTSDREDETLWMIEKAKTILMTKTIIPDDIVLPDIVA